MQILTRVWHVLCFCIPPWPPAVGKSKRKALIKGEAGQGPVAALGRVMGEGAAAVLIVLCCGCVGLFEKRFPRAAAGVAEAAPCSA